jgi:hypothetical protein
MPIRPATRENSPPRLGCPVIRAALLVALPMTLIVAIAVPQATAQSATPTAGDVGSAASRNGYPAAGGAIALPALSASGTAATAAGASAAAAGGAVSGSGSAGGGGGGGRTATSSAGTAGRSSGTGGGTHWVLCPPTGSSGLSPLFTGTDLSCAPD